MNIAAQVVRGANRGQTLYPHRYADGMYVVSTSKHERDYIRLASLADVERKLNAGMGVRMSNPAAGIVSPSFIAASSIKR